MNKDILTGFAWGLAEGTFFFVVPDMLISLAALSSLRRMAVCLAASLVGSGLAGVLVYVVAEARPDNVAHLVQAVPFVTMKMWNAAHQDLAQHGALALLHAPASGSPFKIYAAEAPEYVSFVPFLLLGLLARAARFAAVGGVSYVVMKIFERFNIQNAKQKLILCYILCWIVFYAFYWYGVLSV